jgi:arylsulfate sulfotransferase
MAFHSILRILLYGLVVGLLTGCGGRAEDRFAEQLSEPLRITVNPSGRVPLGALLSFKTKLVSTVRLRVDGEIPVLREFPVPAIQHSIPVLGLYPGVENAIQLDITTAEGISYTHHDTLRTNPLPASFPEIVVRKRKRDAMEPGFHLCELLIANQGKFIPYTVLFDDRGAVRWYMDMSEQAQITYTPYRLRNGNWLYLNWTKLLEVDDLGRTVSEEEMQGIAGNHEIIELPDGRLLMGGSVKDSYVVRDGEQIPTRFDHVVLWDRTNNRPAGKWDMRTIFPVTRSIFPPDYGMDPATDWFHINSIALVPPIGEDILVSGRNQGVVRIDLDNQPKWLLGPHIGWTRAGYNGQGMETSRLLLTAVDADGNPYPRAVQEGRVSAEGFDWPTGQHALNVLPNGNLLLFDNGLRRNFDAAPSYSRAVEYAIDPEKMTVRQIWQYGKERGLDLYSPITSDVDLLPRTGNRLITFGNIRADSGPPRATFVEVTYPEGEVVFEADILFKDALGSGEKSWGEFDLVFRGERYDLLPE